MVNVIWCPTELPSEQHVVVQPYGQPEKTAKAYFYDSEKDDNGGSGPFDFLLDEALERAEQFAADRNIATVVVMKAKLDAFS